MPRRTTINGLVQHEKRRSKRGLPCAAEVLGNVLSSHTRSIAHLGITGGVGMRLIILNRHLYLSFAAAPAERMSVILISGYRVTRSAI